ncbi:hypothetical protein CPS_4548 [Colwellia psychrerythraea 34H]|uniref:Uncharacterized protein n=1 Tax=Colwellia psychrerythraea (strain 34H / ATCC BAA-681) TaxID=167879 RepID=Q47VH6_COLP3|nr:hypothetical protein CPS_4548 [Colwellia psychrerythraea 34H]
MDQFIAHLARMKRLRGKALIEENGNFLVNINNDACKPLPLLGTRPLGTH